MENKFLHDFLISTYLFDSLSFFFLEGKMEESIFDRQFLDATGPAYDDYISRTIGSLASSPYTNYLEIYGLRDGCESRRFVLYIYARSNRQRNARPKRQGLFTWQRAPAWSTWSISPGNGHGPRSCLKKLRSKEAAFYRPFVALHRRLLDLERTRPGTQPVTHVSHRGGAGSVRFPFDLWVNLAEHVATLLHVRSLCVVVLVAAKHQPTMHACVVVAAKFIPPLASS
jgi:hypothetical protein